MKKLILLALLLALAILILTGCDSGSKQKDRTNAAGHPEELQDSTRLDAAPADTSSSVK
jgi:hypothetical protein